LVIIGGTIWSNASTPDLPDMHDREAVRERLSKVDGIRPVLPVTLPLGYDFARTYNHEYSSDDADSITFDEATAPATSWSVFFFPKEGASRDGLPVVIFCVQAPDIRDRFCPEQVDATHLQRKLGQTTVTISRASPGRRDMAAWSAVELTTDLDKVTWLR
jgi:hypothetical protein